MVNILRRIKKYFKEDIVLKNIFKANYHKRVLISYIIYPFLNKLNTHTNCQESRLIAKIFNDCGYIVDVVQYTNQKKINYSEYDIIFGFGEPYENSFTEKRMKRIYYATGAHVCHQNYAEIKRVEEVNKKYSSQLLPKRLVPWNWSMSTGLSDILIVIGNEWTKSTYTKYTKKPVYAINATALINVNSQHIKRDTVKTQSSFLWFGSTGLIHKGLDLCLEYFANHEGLSLHICGPKEEAFFSVFAKYLAKENVFYHGYVDVKSQEFIDITSKCSFSILPTCSEGQATALLTTMGSGLIPIATKYSGVDVEKFGYLLEDTNLESIERVINTIKLIDNDTLVAMSNVVMNYVEKKHVLNEFKLHLKNILTSSLSV